MKILVTAASKYGATYEIAESIAKTLVDSSLQVDVLPITEVDDPGRWDAVVAGSAVYAGHWTNEARTFFDTHADVLAQRPLWLFSSGPVGDPPKPDEDPLEAAQMMAKTKAREHKLFPGKIDRAKLSFAERALTKALRVPEGDYRNWDEITAWAVSIAKSLATPAV